MHTLTNVTIISWLILILGDDRVYSLTHNTDTEILHFYVWLITPHQFTKTE